MEDRNQTPQINVSKIPGGSGIAGALFVVISMVIFLIGIPALRYFLVGAIVLGSAAALAIRAIQRRNPDKPCTLFAAPESANQERVNDSRPDNLGHTLRPISPLA
jgi:hypothetical protein